MVSSLYDLMGKSVVPPVDELQKQQHVEFAIKVTIKIKKLI